MDTNEILEINDEDIKAIANINDREIASKVAKREKLVRQLEIQSYAEQQKIFKGAPKMQEIKYVWRKLRQGVPLYKAIKRICSMTSWEQWRREYPAIAAMELECRTYYLEHLREQVMNIADNPDTHMGSVARDKLMIDVRQREIDRNEGILDRIREAGYTDTYKACNTSINPVQINITYGEEAKRTGKERPRRKHSNESGSINSSKLLP